ncbi:PREDICTED: uncharacterized protein LOC109326106 [Lupinus angustifolius]|uniref:uncharacterized protein LOC109326106 n=1 Tax=Lupinus angustifolius TaxID=3871 RepID=UPI00092FA6F9|nr:PREDICTED: uncharacterized protein LOC109326106 [Lupinus angustifolius]
MMPSKEEIRNAVFAMNGDGAPGPDGFGGVFFQTFWDIVGHDVCLSVVRDFRPIALANFQFKIITKVLADRLASIASRIVSSTLSISVNGQNVGYFGCKRRVRQGDPLPPLLFCLAEEVLSRGILNLVAHGKLSTISGPSSLQTLSHVLYDDDVLIFCKGVKRELRELKLLLSTYAQASSQNINASKSQFFTASSNPRKIINLSSFLGFNAGSLPFTYLGVPVFKGKPKRAHLQPIADRINQKLATWKGSCLTIMGRVELVKSIIQSMLVGGLGVKSISKMNKAYLIKLSWTMLSSSKDWVVFFRKRFGRDCRISTRYYKSSIWSGIKANWACVHLNSIWLVGDGAKIKFWTDNWLGSYLVDLLHIPSDLGPNLKAYVVDFIHQGRWTIPRQLVELFPDVSKVISRTLILNREDKMV